MLLPREVAAATMFFIPTFLFFFFSFFLFFLSFLLLFFFRLLLHWQTELKGKRSTRQQTWITFQLLHAKWRSDEWRLTKLEEQKGKKTSLTEFRQQMHSGDLFVYLSRNHVSNSIFLMLFFSSNLVYSSEIQLVCDGRTDKPTDDKWERIWNRENSRERRQGKSEGRTKTGEGAWNNYNEEREAKEKETCWIYQ